MKTLRYVITGLVFGPPAVLLVAAVAGSLLVLAVVVWLIGAVGLQLAGAVVYISACPLLGICTAEEADTWWIEHVEPWCFLKPPKEKSPDKDKT